jgi:transposase
LKRYQEVIDLYRKGKSYRSIAQQLNLNRMTVARYVQAGSFPEHAGDFMKAKLAPSRRDSDSDGTKEITMLSS